MSAWAKIESWFYQETKIHALVYCRIIFGFTLLSWYLVQMADFDVLYGSHSIGGAVSLQRLGQDLFVEPYLAHYQKFMGVDMGVLRHVSSDILIWTLFSGLLFSAFCFTIGYKTRWTGIALLVLHRVFLAKNPQCVWGWGPTITPYLLLLQFAPVGRYLSLDAYLAGANWREIGSGPAWVVRLFKIHLCIFYGMAGWSRLNLPSWQQGHMVYVIVSSLDYGRFAIDWSPYKKILELVSYFPFVVEPLAPLLLWTKSVGRFWALGLIALHAGLLLLSNAIWWNLFLMAALLVFFPVHWLSRRLDAPLAARE